MVDPDAGCRERLQELGCMVAEAANGSIGQAEAVVLAVKPQDSGAMFEAVRPHLSPGQLVISIMPMSGGPQPPLLLAGESRGRF